MLQQDYFKTSLVECGLASLLAPPQYKIKFVY